MAAENFRLRIYRDGNEFEAEGDEAFVLAMAKRFVPDGVELSSTSKAKVEKPSGTAHVALEKGKVVSLREFIQQLAFSKQTDIALAFAYYLEKHRGAADFSAADVNNCYYEAKMEGSNTSQMIINNIKIGRMMSSRQEGDKGRKRFTITTTGERFVEDRLNSTK